jgi:hypothetical protein
MRTSRTGLHRGHGPLAKSRFGGSSCHKQRGIEGMRVASRPPPRLGRRCRDRDPWRPCSTVLRTPVRLAYCSWGLGKRMTRPTFGRSPRRWSGAPSSSASTWSPSPGRPPISNRTCGLTGPGSGVSCSSSASSAPRPTAGSGAATSPVAGSEPPTPERHDVLLARSCVGAAASAAEAACPRRCRGSVLCSWSLVGSSD